MPAGASPRETSSSAARTFSACAIFPEDAGPQPKLLQRSLAVLAGRDSVDVGHRQASVAEKLGKVEPGLDLDRLRPVLGCDQHDAIAEQVGARLRLDEALGREIVHPVEVGGDEHLRRRALLDLLGERRARGIGDDGLLARLLGPLGVDRIERILEACRREH
jgi:hypothetical protein